MPKITTEEVRAISDTLNCVAIEDAMFDHLEEIAMQLAEKYGLTDEQTLDVTSRLFWRVEIAVAIADETEDTDTVPWTEE